MKLPHYIKLQIPVGLLGALFDSLSFFNHLDYSGLLCQQNPHLEYVFHLSLDFIIAILATLWVLFVFSFGGWLISLLEQAPEELGQRVQNNHPKSGASNTGPHSKRKPKKMFILAFNYGIICSPSCLHLTLFAWSILRQILIVCKIALKKVSMTR